MSKRNGADLIMAFGHDMYSGELGAGIKDYWHSREVHKIDLARVHAPRFKMRVSHFCNHLNYITSGYLYGTKGIVRKEERQREILEHVLFSSGLPKDSKIIEMIRALDPSFAYPPEDGIPYEQFGRTAEKLSRADLTDLTSSQKRVLKMLIGLGKSNYSVAKRVIEALHRNQNRQ